MKNNKTTDWQDYWRKFDELIELLKADSKIEIIAEFKEAQKSVNGLTDGWFEFKFAFEKVIKSYRQEMTDEQTYIAVFLISTLDKSLTNR